jgi:ribosomal protein S27AE
MTDNSNGDDEDWYDDDQDDLDDGESVECPECGTAMSEFLDKCPKCGYWLLDADRRALRPGTLRPLWQRAVAVLLIAGFLFLLLLAGWTIF